MAAHRGPGEQLSLRGHLGAGVTGTDHHEGAQLPAPRRVVAGIGQFHLREQMIAQIQGLGEVLEPLGVIQHPREPQRTGHAPGRDKEPVPADFPPLAVRVGHGDRAAGKVSVDGVTGDEPGTAQRGRQRHRDVPRVDDSGADLGEEREVRHVIGG